MQKRNSSLKESIGEINTNMLLLKLPNLKRNASIKVAECQHKDIEKVIKKMICVDCKLNIAKREGGEKDKKFYSEPEASIIS